MLADLCLFDGTEQPDGNPLWVGGTVPGRMHDQTAIGNAKLQHWRALQRWTGKRETLSIVIQAIAGLASDRLLLG